MYVRKPSGFTWPNVALAATLLVFVAQALWAAWTIDRVVHMTERMEHGTKLLGLAEKWLDDDRAAFEQRRASTGPEQGFLAELAEPDLAGRVQALVQARQHWFESRDRLADSSERVTDAKEQRELQRVFSNAGVEYIRVSQALLNGLMSDIYDSGRTLRDLSMRLYLLGAGLLLSLIAFAFLVRWQVRHNVRVRHEAQVAHFSAKFGQEIASQEEIGQLLQALRTIRE